MRQTFTGGFALLCLLTVLPAPVWAEADDDQLGQLLEDRKLPAAQGQGPVTAVPGGAQVKTRPSPGAPQVKARPSLLLETAPEDAPIPAAAPVAVDTTGVWYQVRQGNLAGARSDLQRLRRQYRDWIPPEDLLTAVFAVAAEPQAPPVLRARVVDVKAEAEGKGWQALSAGQPEQARAWFEQARSRPSARDGLGRALVALDAGVEVRALVGEDPRLQSALAEAALGRALEGLTRGDPAEVTVLRLTLAADLGRQDAWETAGWSWLGLNQPALAADAFTRAGVETGAGGASENALFGRVLAERALGQTAMAEALACDGRVRSARLAGACADALSERQLRAYQAEDYATTLALGEKIGQIAPDRSGPQELRAWSLLRLDRAGEAADLFTRLYDAAPGWDLARALAQSLTAAGRGADLRQRADAGDRSFVRIVHAQGAVSAWGRKQFDLAARHAGALGLEEQQ